MTVPTIPETWYLFLILFFCSFTLYIHTYACVLGHFSHVRLFVTPRTIAGQAPLSAGFSRWEYRRGLLCPPPGDLPNPGSNLRLLNLLLCRQVLYCWATGEATYTSSVSKSWRCHLLIWNAECCPLSPRGHWLHLGLHLVSPGPLQSISNSSPGSVPASLPIHF